MGLTLAELADALGAELRGDGTQRIERVATLQGAGPGDVSFLANRRYRPLLKRTRASAVILSTTDADDCPTASVLVADPYLAYARAAILLGPVEAVRSGIHAAASVDPAAAVDPSAWVGPCSVIEAGARIGPRVQIGPGCVVAAAASIGQDSRLVARVVVCRGVRIGQRALIHPGAVIGGDGFGLAKDGEAWVKIPQLGSVLVGDDVEIGANTTIDRGAIEDTVIEDGVKLDNQIQVAHNVRIGAHTAIAGCVGIAGSTHIGRRCTVGGGVGISGHLEIADDVQLTAAAVVLSSVRTAGTYSSAMPLQEHRAWLRNAQRLRQLDEMAKRIKALEEKLE